MEKEKNIIMENYYFEGEHLNGQIISKGKEYDNDKLIFEWEQWNEQRNGNKYYSLLWFFFCLPILHKIIKIK